MYSELLCWFEWQITFNPILVFYPFLKEGEWILFYYVSSSELLLFVSVQLVFFPHVGMEGRISLQMVSGADMSRKEPNASLPHTSLRLRLETDE